ncbi:hypothetical protein L3Q82_006312 [Scortum barcoo]|uniref:Uncharacterized protein n=1 Tax=Scortum barcoo TaxID=214431 RepID=A0ACB8X321_9TELE|nr:hypothetical protein L3Q82_006312 [Scortum barcoo]
MESPVRSTIKYPSQGLQEGRVLCTAVRPVGTNNSKRPHPQPKKRREATSLASPRVNSNTWRLSWGAISKPTPAQPPLTPGQLQSSGGSSPSQGAGFQSPSCYACVEVSPTISSRYLSTSRTSSGSFPPSEVTFHVPIARVLVPGIGSSRPPATTATQTTLHRPLMDLPAWVVSLLEGGPTSPFRAEPGRVPWAKTRPPGARLRAPTPGLAPGWGPGNANPGDVTVLD